MRFRCLKRDAELFRLWRAASTRILLLEVEKYSFKSPISRNCKCRSPELQRTRVSVVVLRECKPLLHSSLLKFLLYMRRAPLKDAPSHGDIDPLLIHGYLAHRPPK